MRQSIVLAAFLSSTTPALAAQLPTYNPEVFCDAEAAGKAWLRHTCIESEQEAYDDLKVHWSLYSESVQGQAISYTARAGLSYHILQQMLDSFAHVETELQRQKEMQGTNHFKF